MQIIEQTISKRTLLNMQAAMFGNLVKAVVDVDRRIMAVDAEAHSDLEALLLESGSQQQNLWGINIYPDLSGEHMVEFDSMINVRPRQGNRTRSVEDPATRQLIVEIVAEQVID